MHTGDRLDGALLDTLWDFDDPAASVTAFRQALADLPAGSTARAELQTQVARALGLQHLEQDAIAELAAVEAAGPASAQVTARLELERGRIDNSGGRPATAVPHFQAAAAAAAPTDPRTRRWLGSLHNNHGWSLHDRGDAAGALKQFQAALIAHREQRPEQ